MIEFPFTGVPEDYILSSDELETPVEIGINFKTGQVLTDDSGNIVMVEGIEAIKVWTYYAILSERYKHQIFSTSYGSEHTKLIGYEYTKELTESEAYRYIEEALLVNPYIKKVKNKGVEKRGYRLYINIEIDTEYGSADIGGVYS